MICVLVEVAFAAETKDMTNCNWNSDLQKLEPKKKPYAHVFEKNLKIIILVAARHEELYSSTTFLLLRKIFSQNKIDFSIIEAGILPYDSGIDNNEFINESQPENDYYPTGEAGYTALLTIENGGHFQGGEPTDIIIKDGLIRSGFNQYDVLGFYILRNSVIQSNCAINSIESKILFFKKQLGIDSDYRFSQFSDWYLQTNNKNFQCPLQKDEVTPFLNQFGTQKISTSLTNLRDNYISDRIRETLRNKSTSLVVYGAGHAAPQRCSLERDGWHLRQTIFP